MFGTCKILFYAVYYSHSFYFQAITAVCLKCASLEVQVASKFRRSNGQVSDTSANANSSLKQVDVDSIVRMRGKNFEVIQEIFSAGEICCLSEDLTYNCTLITVDMLDLSYARSVYIFQI